MRTQPGDELIASSGRQFSFEYVTCEKYPRTTVVVFPYRPLRHEDDTRTENAKIVDIIIQNRLKIKNVTSCFLITSTYAWHKNLKLKTSKHVLRGFYVNVNTNTF